MSSFYGNNINLGSGEESNVIVVDSLPSTYEGQADKYYLVTGTPMKVYTFNSNTSRYEQKSMTVEQKPVYMKFVNDSTADVVPELRVSPVLNAQDDIRGAIKYLHYYDDQSTIYLISPFTWSLVFNYDLHQVDNDHELIGEYLDGNQWKDLGIIFHNAGMVQDNDLYKYYYLMYGIGTYTTPLSYGRHLRFRYVDKENLEK